MQYCENIVSSNESTIQQILSFHKGNETSDSIKNQKFNNVHNVEYEQLEVDIIKGDLGS
jgi:hypothetical protein